MTDRVLKAEAKTAVLPSIPAKRYFTIGEVSELCGVKPHVLRYWEQEFTQLKPVKRRGNRRYYQHHEVLLIRRIRELLYEHVMALVIPAVTAALHRFQLRKFLLPVTQHVRLHPAQVADFTDREVALARNRRQLVVVTRFQHRPRPWISVSVRGGK